jgi:AraC family transcriptional regulator
MGVYKYVQLNRLRRAAQRLAFNPHSQVVDIALASGYETPESFARAFKKSTGQTPTQFRVQPQWDPWYVTYQSLSELRINHMKSEYRTDQVGIVNFQETRVATFEHRGDPKLIGDSVRKFIAWRRQNNLPPRSSATFNIVYDNPAGTDPDNYRFDLCAATDRDVDDTRHGIVSKRIPAGRCAVLRNIGSDDKLGGLVSFLYSEWLPRSGEELRDFPLYFQRVSFFPEVPEHEAVTDVFLPLK